MSQQATIILIGGAFQTTDFFEPLKSALEALGFPVVLPTLPTCSDTDRAELGKKDVSDDAQAVQKEVEALVTLPENVSFRQLNSGKIPDFDQCMDDGTYNFLIAEDTFLNDLSQAHREKWAAKLIPHTQKVFDFSCSDAAWKYVPNIFLVCEKDKAIPASFQDMSAQLVSAKKVVRLDMGHGCHLAAPDALAEAVSNALHSVGA